MMTVAGVANWALELSVSNLASCTESGSGSVACAALASPPKLRFVMGAPSWEYSMPSCMSPLARVPPASTPGTVFCARPSTLRPFCGSWSMRLESSWVLTVPLS